MKTVMIAVVLCLASVGVASAQSVTVQDGKVVVKDSDGKTVVIGGENSKGAGAEGATDGGSKEAVQKSTVACKDRNDITIQGVVVNSNPAVLTEATCSINVVGSTLESKVTAIRVTGTGDVSLKATTVKAGKFAIDVSASGNVVLDGVTIDAPTAIRISGSGNVTAKNSVIKGKITSNGSGKFIDGGGNTLAE